MYDKNNTVTSIPKRNESEDEVVKWVPKKKHEVLKAKYKCLKKLFQIYDASVIGILPQKHAKTFEEPPKGHRRKRSHRTKSDACTGTTEVSAEDVSVSLIEKSATSAVIRDLNLQQHTSKQFSKTNVSNFDDKSTQESKDDVSTESVSGDRKSKCIQTSGSHPIPYLVFDEKRRLSRFQSFINRILGIKREERERRYNIAPTGHVYAVSDNNVSNRYEKPKRRSLSFQRRRPKKVHTDNTLRDAESPIILSYIQSVQRSCLMDTNPRKCPILGCSMIFYGIIKYNDHLNLCHFPYRKFVCHYCHEGFASEYDKLIHENEHLGITKIGANISSSPSTDKESRKNASITQAEPDLSKSNVPEENLKKIVSFLDKIADPCQAIDQIKKNRFSESNLSTFIQSFESMTMDVEDSKNSDCHKKLRSADLQKAGKKCGSSADSEWTSNYSCGHHLLCRFCGENFDYRHQLNLHVDLEDQDQDKFFKFHRCSGIGNRSSGKAAKISSEDGMINIRSLGPVSSQSSYSKISGTKSVETVICVPSTNLINISVASVVKKPSLVGSLVDKIRSYKWEPGTKIIRV